MKFSKHEDVNVPQHVLFDKLTNFGNLERELTRRGLKVSVADGAPAEGQGAKWDLAFKFRGKRRTATLEATKVHSPDAVGLYLENPSMDIRVEIELTALSKNKTRMMVTSVLQPRTLAARLLVQSMKLGRGRFNKKYSARIKQIAEELGRD